MEAQDKKKSYFHFFKPRKIKTRRSYKNVRKIWTSCERKWIKLFYETKVDNSLFVFLSPWSTVNTPCNTSCGGGGMMKVRSCTNPRPQGKDGKICEGIDKQYFPCNTEPCDMQVGCGLSNRWGGINSTNFLTSTLMNTKFHKPLQSVVSVVWLVGLQRELWSGDEDETHQVRQGGRRGVVRVRGRAVLHPHREVQHLDQGPEPMSQSLRGVSFHYWIFNIFWSNQGLDFSALVLVQPSGLYCTLSLVE